MDERIVAKLYPSLEGHYLVVQVTEYPERAALEPYRYSPRVFTSRAKARMHVTNSTGFSSESLTAHTAMYEWDTESEGWTLVDYIEQNTHKDDFPWRKKKN